MADNDQDSDEYKFDDPDALGSESMGDTPGDEGLSHKYNMPSSEGRKNVLRNALIAVFLLILSMLAYKLVSGIFSGKKSLATTHRASTVVQKKTISETVQEPVMPIPEAPMATTNTTQDDVALNQKLSAVEQGQQTMRQDVGSINTQVAGVNASVNALMTKMVALNQVIEQLSAKVEQQSHIIEVLMTRPKPKTRRHARVNPSRLPPRYHIQAVIPGRAWLIAANGATLTVREGTLIDGYGVVKLIDPLQGRVLINSGQVIRFSQDDS